MNYNKKTVMDVEVAGKKVLLRCDFNVPMAKDGSGVITDDKRIRAALPTIQYLLAEGAAVIACSHMGKPKGEVKPELSLKPVAARLSELLGQEVIMAADVVGEDAMAKAAALKAGQVLLLETPALKRARPRTIPSWPRLWLPWLRSMCPTLSALCTAHTLPPPAWQITCPLCPVS